MKAAKLAAELQHMGYIFFYDRVAVLLDEAESKYGGLVLPDGAQVKKQTGTIVAIGEGVDVSKTGVRVMDRVVFQRWNPTTIEVVRLDGSPQLIAMYATYDLYVGWRDDDGRAAFEVEVQRLSNG